MLSFHAYYEALAKIGDPTHPNWHSTVAGLTILRLIDDWLNTKTDTHQLNDTTRSIAKALIEQILPIEPLKPILHYILDQLTCAEPSELEIVATPLLAYAQRLHNDGQYALAHDALVPMLTHALRIHKTALAIQLSLKLGMITRIAGDYTAAEEYYYIVNKHARAQNDDRSRWKAATGLGKILISRGELSRAELLYGTIESEVQKTGDSKMLRLMLHEQASIASTYYDDHRSVDLIRRAMACAAPDNIDDSDAIEIDLALCLLEIGHVEESKKLSLRASILAHDYALRKRAALILLRTAILEHDTPTFHMYRTALALTPLSPMIEVQYYGEVARGLRLFGDETGAEHELRKARAIARQSQVHPMFIE